MATGLTRSVAGLDVPLPLVPRIIAAIRGQYPTVTEGLDNDAAVRAWLKHIVAVTLASWEGQQPLVDVEAEVEQLRKDRRALGRLAQEKALEDASAINEKPPPVALAPDSVTSPTEALPPDVAAVP